jgi:hypothetical protein
LIIQDKFLILNDNLLSQAHREDRPVKKVANQFNGITSRISPKPGPRGEAGEQLSYKINSSSRRTNNRQYFSISI